MPIFAFLRIQDESSSHTFGLNELTSGSCRRSTSVFDIISLYHYINYVCTRIPDKFHKRALHVGEFAVAWLLLYTGSFFRKRASFKTKT